jgi:hypothetical protein
MFIYEYNANGVTSKCDNTDVISFVLNGFITLPRRGLCDNILYVLATLPYD